MLKNYFYLFFSLIFILSIIFLSNISFTSKYFWPTPNYEKITSYFGFRIHPTTFKKSFHSGIDISAPEGTFIHSVCTGKVIFTGFNGAYGYSIIVKNNNYEVLYAHVSPKFLVQSNHFVNSGQIIGNVGPKYIQNFDNNIYYDSSRKSN